MFAAPAIVARDGVQLVVTSESAGVRVVVVLRSRSRFWIIQMLPSLSFETQ